MNQIGSDEHPDFMMVGAQQVQLIVKRKQYQALILAIATERSDFCCMVFLSPK